MSSHPGSIGKRHPSRLAHESYAQWQARMDVLRAEAERNARVVGQSIEAMEAAQKPAEDEEPIDTYAGSVVVGGLCLWALVGIVGVCGIVELWKWIVDVVQ